MIYQVFYKVTCPCGSGVLSYGEKEGDIIIDNELRCLLCDEVYTINEYYVRIL
jgi:hypothetical protein